MNDLEMLYRFAVSSIEATTIGGERNIKKL